MKPTLTLLAAFIALAFPVSAQEYQLGPDPMPQEGVPKGAVTKHSWTPKVFPGTVRDYWVYVPARYQPSQPACVMVFQDGGAARDEIFVTMATRVFKRKTKAKGVLPFEPPIVPPKPRL